MRIFGISEEIPQICSDNILDFVDLYSNTALQVQMVLGGNSSSIAILG